MPRTTWLLVWAAGLGTAAILASIRTAWRRPAWWLAVGLMGYAASLQLIDAGPVIRYQHYAPVSEWPARTLAVLVLAVEIVVVGVGLRAQWPAIRRLLGGWPARAAVGAALVFVGTSAVPSADGARFAIELVAATAIQLLHLAAALLVAASLPADAAEFLDRIARRWLDPDSARTGWDRSVVALAIVAGVVPLVLAAVVYQFHPHVPDELSYLIHARYLAHGLLWLPVPEPAAAFGLDLMFATGDRWFSPVPPGWPAMLAIGVKLGIPWLINPILNAINVLLLAALVGELYDRRTARLAATLYATSPWTLFLAMSLLTHTFTLTAGLGAALAVARFRRTLSTGWMVAGGVGIGIVSLIRPLEGLILAGLLGLWSLGVRPWRALLAGTATLVITTAAVGGLTLPYNKALTGSSRVFPLMAYSDALYGPGTNDVGFGPNRGLGWSGLDPFPGHGPRDVIINTDLNLTAINPELLGWAMGSLGLLTLFVLAGRFRPGDRGLIAVIAATIGAHAFYWFAGGPDFGARYWYLAAAPALILTARAMLQRLDAGASVEERGRIVAALLALMLGSAVVFVPWRAADKYFRYRGMRPGIRALAAEHRIGGGLILVRGRRHPDYASAAEMNLVLPEPTAPLVAWDRDPATRRATLARFPERPVWIVDGPTVTGDGYRLVAGPLAADSVARLP